MVYLKKSPNEDNPLIDPVDREHSKAQKEKSNKSNNVNRGSKNNQAFAIQVGRDNQSGGSSVASNRCPACGHKGHIRTDDRCPSKGKPVCWICLDPKHRQHCCPFKSVNPNQHF